MQNEISRLPRIIALLTQLQTRRVSKAAYLSEKFKVSVRTIYRDMKALQNAGVPIFTEEGKGFSLVEGYSLPPVSFTESQANAMITAEQLVLRNKDVSFVNEYLDAVIKIKSVLKSDTKDNINLLSERIAIRNNIESDRSSNNLSAIQLALTGFKLLQIVYVAEDQTETSRMLEPFAVYSTQENWLMIAFCRLRKEYRSFRLDRIKQLSVLLQTFEPHKLTLSEYFQLCKEKSNR